MSDMATLFSKVQPLSLEMLDEKAAITKHLTPSVLSSIESEMKELVDSFRSIVAQKKKMGAFSTREQNKALNDARTKHTQLAPTLKWFLERIADFYSKFWPLGDTNAKMLDILNAYDFYKSHYKC